MCIQVHETLAFCFSKNDVSLSLVQFQPFRQLRLPVIPGMQGAFQDQSWRRFPLTPQPVLQPDPGASSSSIGKYLQPVSDDDTIIELLLDGIQTQLLETETAASQQNSGTSSCVPSKIFPLSDNECVFFQSDCCYCRRCCCCCCCYCYENFFFITSNQTRVS